MMRNLILIHMESLNMLNYRFNREYFPHLCEIERNSLTFSNYFSSATSTLMVLSDLAYQGSYINETLRTLKWKRHGCVEENSLLDDLFDRGYGVTMLHYPSIQSKNGDIELNSFIGKRRYIKECVDNITYHNEILKILEQSKPFALWLCNFMSHMDFNMNIAADKSGMGRWMRGYEYLDQELAYIFDLLRERKLLENTTIILYGDHGDDIYSHGYHGGLTHAVEPYAQLIHTPMFVYDGRLQPETVSSVVSTVEIANIAKELLNMSDRCCKDWCFPSVGRRYAFSRNMFAVQKVRESFGKGYSVTDGQFLLLVNTKGMAMYEIKMDPTCQNNLLLFYKLESNGQLLKDEIYLGHHFRYLMDKKTFKELEEKFYELRDILRGKVAEIYQSGKCMEVQQPVVDFGADERKKWTQQNQFEVFATYFMGKRVVLYGAGDYGRFCYDQMKDSCDIVAWVDKNYKEHRNQYDCDIIAPETILIREFDLIYIAIMNDKIRQSVFDMLVGWGIEENLIVV